MINDVLTHWSLNCWLVGDVTSNVISPSSNNISHIKPPWKLLHSGKPTTISRLPFRVCPRGHTLKPMTTRVRVNIFQFIEQENNKMLKTGLIVLARTPAVRALCHMCVDNVPLSHQTTSNGHATVRHTYWHHFSADFCTLEEEEGRRGFPRVEIVNRITNSFGVLTDTFEQRTTRKLHVPTRASYHPSWLSAHTHRHPASVAGQKWSAVWPTSQVKSTQQSREEHVQKFCRKPESSRL